MSSTVGCVCVLSEWGVGVHSCVFAASGCKPATRHLSCSDLVSFQHGGSESTDWKRLRSSVFCLLFCFSSCESAVFDPFFLILCETHCCSNYEMVNHVATGHNHQKSVLMIWPEYLFQILDLNSVSVRIWRFSPPPFLSCWLLEVSLNCTECCRMKTIKLVSLILWPVGVSTRSLGMI